MKATADSGSGDTHFLSQMASSQCVLTWSDGRVGSLGCHYRGGSLECHYKGTNSIPEGSTLMT